MSELEKACARLKKALKKHPERMQDNGRMLAHSMIAPLEVLEYTTASYQLQKGYSPNCIPCLTK